MHAQELPAVKASTARDLGEAFVAALAGKDVPALAALFADPVDFRAMTPGRSWEARTPAAVAGEVILGAWFEPTDVVGQVEHVDTAVVGDRYRLGYRLQVSNADGRFVVEQQGFLALTGGKITWMRMVCSGYRPAGGRP
jgi:hypothetical protein